jgi:hypothetical protein
MWGPEEGSEASGAEDQEGGYSHKRMCVGLCGVFPSIVWTCILLFMVNRYQTGSCSSTSAGDGDIMYFIQLSAGGFGVLVLIEIIEGCIAGEHDFRTSPVEILINFFTVVVFIAIYCINYYGVIELYTATNCQGGLLTAGWITLVGNNIVWFTTVATMIGTAFCGTAIAAADWASGDRL